VSNGRASDFEVRLTFGLQSMLAESVTVDFDHKETALSSLRRRFAHIIVSRCGASHGMLSSGRALMQRTPRRGSHAQAAFLRLQ
jgi:hypothetical protein